MSQVAFGQLNQTAMAQFGNVSRFSGGTQNTDFASVDAFNGRRSARVQNNGNFIGTALTAGALILAGVAGFALTKRIFTPAILKNITSLEALAGTEANTIVKGAFKFASKEADKEVAGTLKYMENSGFLGFFRKAEIAVEGGATRTVRMWRVPGNVKEILTAAPEQLSTMALKWEKVADAGLKLGAETLPAGAAQTKNVLGQVIGAVKTSATEAKLYLPAADGSYAVQTVAYDQLPSALRGFFITG